MAPSRLERLQRLLGGHLPSPDVQNSHQWMQPTCAETSANDNLDVQTETTTSLQGHHYRAPLAYGPLSARTPIVRSPTEMSSRPVHISLAPNQNKALQNSDRQCGDPAPFGLQFCPFVAITKFPYKFVSPQYKQLVATAFFDAEKIWNRDWDLYYVWTQDAPTAKPVVFVAATEVQSLLDEVNTTFPDLSWTFTDAHEERGLLVSFPSSNINLRPRWLGHSNSRASHDLLQNKIEAPHPKTQGAEVADSHTFQESIEQAVNVVKHKSNRSTAKKGGLEDLNMAKRNASEVQLDHARKYLGIAQQPSHEDVGSTKELTSSVKDEVIFIAIDIEAYERAQHKITEVGIATLDTKDITPSATGDAGRDWQKHIRGRHFIIQDHKHLVNKAFVKGCPDKFEFGESELVSLSDLPQVLASCFNPPYSNFDHNSNNTENRKIILVGHGISNDINYCHKVGFSILNRSSIVEVIDTAKVDRAFTKTKNERGLAKIMLAFDYNAWNLHNAGNDAVYTLWALLGMCCDLSCKPDVTPGMKA